MITSKLVLIPVLALALVSCDKKTSKTKAAPAPAASVSADGTRVIPTRVIPIEVRKVGYVPDKVTIKPGEKFRLVFTRVEATECGAQVKVADGKLLDLPMNVPVEVAMTAPASGEVRFACGMDMMTGVVIVDAADHI